MDKLATALAKFTEEGGIKEKGALAVMLVVTRHAKELGLPLASKNLITKEGGQVLGLGMGAVQSILREYGITRILAKEGGRTSRGSIGQMQRYVAFLNELHSEGIVDIDRIEPWWVDRVRDYFGKRGIALTFDQSKSLRYLVDDLFGQAVKRQQESPGTMVAGAILQHLVGAKLSIILGDGKVTRNGFSVADEMSNRSGDFVIEDVSIHVTTAPSEALMSKCVDNLNAGVRPLIITTAQSIAGAQSLAEIKGIAQRVDIMEAGQFLATNVYEWSKFKSADRRLNVEMLVKKYNEIVAECETDPGLRIALGK